MIKPFVYIIDGFEDTRFNEGRHRRTALANFLATQTEGVATLDGLHLLLTHETLTLSFLTRRASLLRLDLSNLPGETNIR